jgi:NADPH:quinone reductase-like Zn-dependent oxidoreductase
MRYGSGLPESPVGRLVQWSHCHPGRARSWSKPRRFARVEELFEAGKIVPVIDKSYPLSETPEAMHHFGVEHAQEKIINAVEQGKNEP